MIFFQAEDGIRDGTVTGVQTCALPISLSAAESKRMIALLDATWKYLDQVRAKSPESLRKGPRGGGRDREKMYAHVLDAELRSEERRVGKEGRRRGVRLREEA